MFESIDFFSKMIDNNKNNVTINPIVKTIESIMIPNTKNVSEDARLKAEMEKKNAEEQIRLLADQAELQQLSLVIRIWHELMKEVDAERIIQKEMATIKVEMDRLKNRSKIDILEEKVAELTALVHSLKECRY